MTNRDPNEISKFDKMASQWWDKEGPCKPLHELNPLRLSFIEQHADLNGKAILDVGCGGGILSESLAIKGGNVTAIDLSKEAISVAKLHALDTGLTINYQHTSIEDFAKHHTQAFDIVTCMELLEHVPSPARFIQSVTEILKPGGQIFLSTLNRNPKSYLYSIIGAEYILKLLPRGTHDYEKFIKPSELSEMCREAGLDIQTLRGLNYSPLKKRFSLSTDTSVNYLAYAIKND